jgi:FkbM family methyltransferase
MPQIPLVDRLFRAMISHRTRGVERLRLPVGAVVRIDEITAATKYGSVFRLRPHDYIDNIVLREGYYESEVLEAMLKTVPANGVLWDVGANFGLHSITLKKLRPDVRVLCFEPAPDQAARLLVHANINGVEVALFCMGLGRGPGTAVLHIVRGNPGMNTFTPWEQATYSGVQCYLDCGDNLISSGAAARPDVVKLDIEGGELDALAGMSRLFSKAKPTIICEGGAELSDTFEWMQMSFRPLVRHEATSHALNNYIATPR